MTIVKRAIKQRRLDPAPQLDQAYRVKGGHTNLSPFTWSAFAEGQVRCQFSFRKEVIQPQVLLRLPCYDFTPVMDHKVVSALPKVKLPTSFATHSHGVTGGVYKARERIHRSILIYDY